MKRIIIADIGSVNESGVSIGHYMSVASNYVELFQDTYKVIVAGGPIYKNKFSENLLRLNYDTVIGKPIIFNKFKQILNLRQLFNECKNDDIIVLQSIAVATSYFGIMLFQHKNNKLFMIQYNTFGMSGGIKRILYFLARRKIEGIICPSDEIGKAYGIPYCVVPDYICPKKISDNMNLNYKNEKRYDFGIVGIISKDKGVTEVIKRLKNTQYKILISGKPQNKEIEKELREDLKNVCNIDMRLGYLSEKEYDINIKSCRYCILNYSDAYSQHSSGVVFDIIFRGVPVIGRKCKSLEFIQIYRLGELFDNINKWKPESLFDKNNYLELTQNIYNYCNTQIEYVNKIKQFFNSRS